MENAEIVFLLSICVWTTSGAVDNTVETQTTKMATSSTHNVLENGALLIGQIFHLKCASSNRVCGSLQWLRRDSADAPDEAITYGRILTSDFGGRYAMNDSGTPCDVRITDVQPSDAGEFSCMSPDLGRQSAFLAVLESHLHCSANMSHQIPDHTDTDDVVDEVLEGSRVQIACRLSRFHPGTARVSLTWSHGDNVQAYRGQHQDRMTSGHHGRAHDSFHLDGGVDFREESYSEVEEFLGITTEAQTIRSSFMVVAQSSHVVIPSFVCRATFHPPSHNTDQLTARNAPEVTCATKRLRVVYPVRHIRLVKNGTRLIDGDLVTCVADGKPTPSYQWFIHQMSGKHGEEILHGATVVVRSFFVYQCIASNRVLGRVYKDFSWEISVHVPISVDVAADKLTTQPTNATPTFAWSAKSTTSSAHRTEDIYDIMREDKHHHINVSAIVIGLLLILAVLLILFLVYRLRALRRRLKDVVSVLGDQHIADNKHPSFSPSSSSGAEISDNSPYPSTMHAGSNKRSFFASIIQPRQQASSTVAVSQGRAGKDRAVAKSSSGPQTLLPHKQKTAAELDNRNSGDMQHSNTPTNICSHKDIYTDCVRSS